MITGNIDLFYSETEKILFWVAGYTDNSVYVNTIIETLKNNREHFKRLGAIGTVKTDVITDSRRYKSMRVFWCEDIEEQDCPETAFHLSVENEWTMWKWLKY